MTGRGPLASALGDRYRIERTLGAGGMATVYLARDLKHDRDVALKVLPPELGTATGEQRFLNEIRITSRLQHPHILTLIDSGASSGTLWYVVPYVRGESLRQRLVREGQLPIADAISITRQVASALDFAHRQNVLHRDVKPENILLHEGVAVLADFGVALALEEVVGERLTGTGLSVGTPAYMSPEQATRSRHLDSRTDIYSLGAVLYEMLAGEPPHTGPNAQAVFARLLTEKPTPLRLMRDTVSPAIEAAVARALARVPADRFATAGEFAAELGAEGSPPPWPARTTRRVALIAGLAIAVTAAVLGGSGLRRRVVPGPVTPEITQLTTSGHSISPLFSPDGSQIAFVRTGCDEAGTCTQSLLLRETGEDVERVVVDGVRGSIHLRAWSPSGRRLLYTTYDSVDASTAYIVSRLGGAPTRLGRWSSGDFAGTDDTLLLEPPPNPAPPGRLYVVVTRTGEVLDSLSLPAGIPQYSPFAIAPDGRRIVFWRAASGGRTAVVIMERGGRVLSDTLGERALALRWDRNSSEVIYAKRMTSTEHVGLFRRALDHRSGKLDSAVSVVSGLEVGTVGVAYDLSSDARSVVYARRRELKYTLWTIERSTPVGPFQRVRLIQSATKEPLFLLSGDGKTLFTMQVSSGPDGEQVQFLAQPYGGGPAHAVTPPLNGLSDYSIARDGRRLLVAQVVDGRARLAWYDVQSGEKTDFSEIPEKRLTTWITDKGGAAWMRPTLDTVHVLDARGRPTLEIPLSDSVRPGYPLPSSPDGSEIGLITTGQRTGSHPWAIWRVSLADGRVRLVTRIAQFSEYYGVAWTNDGWIHMNMTAYGSIHPHMFRVPMKGGELELETTLPFEGTVTPFSLARDGLHAVVLETSFQSDLMLARLTSQH